MVHTSFDNEELLLDVPFTVDEVKAAIRKFKCCKAAGLDGLVAGLDGLVAGLDGLVAGLDGLVAGLDGLVAGLDGLVAGLDGLVAGLDGLVAEHLKYAGESMVIWLRNIMNALRELEMIPDFLKKGVVVPVYKGGGKDPLLINTVIVGSLLTSILSIFDYG